jgi:hypothetical protein
MWFPSPDALSGCSEMPKLPYLLWLCIDGPIRPRKGASWVACAAHTVPQHWEWFKFDALGYLIVTSPIRNQNQKVKINRDHPADRTLCVIWYNPQIVHKYFLTLLKHLWINIIFTKILCSTWWPMLCFLHLIDIFLRKPILADLTLDFLVKDVALITE